MEDAVQSTIDAMESIINQDLVEIAKWKELIKKLESIDERRKSELCHALEATCLWHTQRAYLHRWNRYLAVKRQWKRREKIAHMLLSGTEKGLTFLYFQKLERFYLQQKKDKRQRAMVRGLVAGNDNSLTMAYWKKMKCYTMVIKKRAETNTIAECMASHSTDGLRRITWKKMKQFVDTIGHRRRRNAIASNIMRCSEKGILQQYYFNLRSYRVFKLKMLRKLRAAECMSAGSTRIFTVNYFRKLRLFARMSARAKRRGGISDVMGTHTSIGIISRYYNKIVAYYKSEATDKLKRKIELEQQRNAELQTKYDAKAAVLARLKTLDDKRKEIEDALASKHAAAERYLLYSDCGID